ncbi:MAG TPA: PhzF family phenazine biosynthesis protein [Solirubrobacteraceae bacterium]|nr:PhzF family phenazine biosynthesis protein [Solirubrobacteraceae bacterium]
MRRPFRQVDVFTSTAFAGNPVGVVLDGTGIDDAELQRFASWTNLSETTFVLDPVDPTADYGVRIFTPTRELPFAGHPTLGTCHAWLDAGGEPRSADVILQECPAGLIRIRRTADGLAFAAPPLIRSGPVDEPVLRRIAGVLRIGRDEILDGQWVDNGPGWVAVVLADAAAVLAVRPGPIDMEIGVVGAHPDGSDCAYEVRAFFPKDGATVEDPVTGSLNASLAGWLIDTGRARPPYVASQGTALGRAGRVHISTDADGTIWVGGGTITCLTGEPPTCSPGLRLRPGRPGWTGQNSDGPAGVLRPGTVRPECRHRRRRSSGGRRRGRRSRHTPGTCRRPRRCRPGGGSVRR